jgi:hypothetical protein
VASCGDRISRHKFVAATNALWQSVAWNQTGSYKSQENINLRLSPTREGKSRHAFRLLPPLQ